MLDLSFSELSRNGIHVLTAERDVEPRQGAGSKLPSLLLGLTGFATAVATIVSFMSIYQHLKNYRQPFLQRMVVRIMIMIPIYAISSLIALHSLDAAFFIDAIRDIYEAFVIYCFFQLLLFYLGGERSLLILLHGRPPKEPVFPLNLFKHEIDVSDPYTFLALKRGILQYVQVKPVLAIATLILKATGNYNEGQFRADSGYLYISIVYNVSICVSLYCLAMFWVCVNDDLKPFRPVPKFLCVKGILFFSFWQSIFVSGLVTAGVITRLGPYMDMEHISLGLTDTLVAFEMPLFAIAHMYAFAPRDFSTPSLHYVARMPAYYAFRDAFGLKDVVEDSRATLRGEGMDYRTFEPSEGFMHQGIGRERRIKAGLRYSKGGKTKYWLPLPVSQRAAPGKLERGINNAVKRLGAQPEEVHAPLLEAEAEDVYHIAPDLQGTPRNPDWDFHGVDGDPDAGFDLPFSDIDEEDEELFDSSRRYLFGDYNYPNIDVSSEQARIMIWSEEERVLSDERGAWASPIRGPGTGYGAVSLHPNSVAEAHKESGKGKARMQDDQRASEERIIDYDADRAGLDNEDRDKDDQDGAIKFKWTNVKRLVTNNNNNNGRLQPSNGRGSPSSSSPITPRSRKTSNSNNISPSGSGSGSGGENVHSPPQMSRNNSRTLPPDAVDLIVEDPEAADEERARERRKGEPALGGAGLRKVYRRGFVIDDPENKEEIRGEMEVDDPEVEPSGAAEKNIAEAEESEERLFEEVDGVVAREETTPPIHARVLDLPPDEANPWA